MSSPNILVIGGGNMGATLASCWHDTFPDNRIIIAETDAEKRAWLRGQGFNAPDELDVPEDGYGVIVVAIKPQGFAEFAPRLAEIAGDATIISIMAGITLDTIKGAGLEFVARVMPNTPAIINEGMSVIYAPDLAADRLGDVQSLFEACGRIAMIDDEAQMHAVTAVSGSGPAYVFAFMEALEEAAIGMGLDAQLARILVVQTITGSSMLAEATQNDPAVLRKKVTSPGGTTEAALKVLASEGFDAALKKAVKAAQKRSGSMS